MDLTFVTEFDSTFSEAILLKKIHLHKEDIL